MANKTTHIPIFVALEGIDGSGKGTQVSLLVQALQDMGRAVSTFSFPRYQNKTSVFTKNYLNGKYGASVHPDLASLTYALDRFGAKEEIAAELKKGHDVILDRYVASNLGHQGAQIPNTDDRLAFYDSIIELEYGTLGLPRPQLNIVLLVQPRTAQKNVDNKELRTYTHKKRDILEADEDHLRRAKANFEELCRLYPDFFVPVHCMNEKNELRSIEDIHTEIMGIVKALGR